MRDGKCVSCGQGLVSKGSAKFPCPNCEEVLHRCGSCREQAVAWQSTCGFMGV